MPFRILLRGLQIPKSPCYRACSLSLQATYWAPGGAAIAWYEYSLHGKIVSQGHEWDRVLVAWREPGGRKRRKSFRRKTDARSYKAEIEGQLDRGDYFTKAEQKVTLGDYIAQMIDTSYDLKPGTLRNQRLTLSKHLNPLSGAPLPEVTASRLRELLSALPEGSVRYSTYKLLNKALRRARQEGLIRENPLERVPGPRLKSPEIKPLSVEQVEALASAYDPRMSLAVHLAAYAGLRGGECGGLRIQDIDLPGSRLVVRQQVVCNQRKRYLDETKGKKVRSLSIGQSLVSDIESHVERFGTASDGRLFHREEELCGSLEFQQRLKTAAKKIGLTGVRFHDLRHTAAALLIESGVHPRRIQQRLGHASIVVTMGTYGHLMPGGDEDVAKGLDELRAKSHDVPSSGQAAAGSSD